MRSPLKDILNRYSSFRSSTFDTTKIAFTNLERVAYQCSLGAEIARCAGWFVRQELLLIPLAQVGAAHQDYRRRGASSSFFPRARKLT